MSFVFPDVREQNSARPSRRGAPVAPKSGEQVPEQFSGMRVSAQVNSLWGRCKRLERRRFAAVVEGMLMPEYRALTKGV